MSKTPLVKDPMSTSANESRKQISITYNSRHELLRTFGAGVSTGAEQGGVLLAEIGDICQKSWDGIFISDSELVPVVWNFLVANSVLEVT